MLNDLLCDKFCACGSIATLAVTPFRCTDVFYYCDDCYAHDQKIVPINKSCNKLEILGIDQIANQCGMYDEGRCKARQNTQGEGMCHTFACPLAYEMDDETPGWTDDMDGCDYMLQHSEFADT